MNADKERKPAFSPLFTSIAFWVLLAILLAALVAAVLLKLLGWSFSFPAQGGAAGDNASDLYKFIQSVLTIVAGIGAVAYLVIKYRERSDAEDSKAEKRLNDAINQLGDESPQVRIAGVYALADIADTFQGPYKQRVVDILCGYLRVERSSDGEEAKPRDASVESTVLSVIAERVRHGVIDAKTWSDCFFDLHGAVFHENICFSGTIWRGGINFSDSEFHGELVLVNSFIGESSSFQRIKPNDRADFSRAEISGGVSFYGARFLRWVFDGHLSLREGVSFGETKIGDFVDFSGAWFYGEEYRGGEAFSDWVRKKDWRLTIFKGAIFGAEEDYKEVRRSLEQEIPLERE